MFAIYHARIARSKDDILSGLTVSLALVPEAVAFAFVAGVHPLVALYSAFFLAIITASLGGRPGMISGATGALAVVMVSLVKTHGVEYLFAAVLLMGLIQILVGFLRLGKFIRIVPFPVMLGFVNGLAIVIFLAQLQHFKVEGVDGTMVWVTGQTLYVLLGLIGLTMAIIHFLPKITRAIPSSLAAIVVVTLIALVFGLDARTVKDFAEIGGGLPAFHIPQVSLTFETLGIIFPYSIIFAAVGLIESLLTLRVIDEITETRGRGNRECVAQGIANTVSGVFSGMGGCAMIGQSMINVNSGGLGRLSGISAALFLLSFVLFASPLIEIIPLAALIGVMFMVVLGTFEWASFRFLKRVPFRDCFVGITVCIVTVFSDLAVAVVVGVILSALIFAWENAKYLRADIENPDESTRIYNLHGPLFFGSVHSFFSLFDTEGDPGEVIIEFKHSRVADHSALEAIDTLAERYKKLGKRLHLRHLSNECRQLLKKAGDIVEVNIKEDPTYFVADDRLA